MSNFAGGGKNKRPAVSQTGHGITGTDALGRRVWDKEVFEPSSSSAPKSARVVAPVKSTLQERSLGISFEDQVNVRRIVTNASSKAAQGGFYCEPCDMLLKDSGAYLDHINGKTHNKICGMNMNVEQVSVDRVVAKMKMIRQGMVTR